MGQPFEINYAPDQWNAPAGGVATAWATPYGGLNVQAPANCIDPSNSPALNNVLLRNSEIRSRPLFRQLFPGPDGNNIVLACGSFLSPAQVWHTFAITPRGLFQLATNALALVAQGTNPWQFLGGPAQISTAPVNWQSYAGTLYYGNGTHLSAWNGSSTPIIADVAFLGSVSPPPVSGTVFGGVFLAELDSHIIIAYVTETTNGASTRFANRIRWSNSGFNPILNGVFGANLGTPGATFDPAQSVNAGLNDFLDVPDIITGLMTLGQQGYLFRQNGITTFTPTGNGIAPFDFNHLWASQNGIGSVYPFTLAQYGNMGIFISFEQIYQITPGNISAIGHGARDAIMSDLALATGSPKASLDRGFTLGYTFLHYHLRIPQSTGTRSYVFSIEENNWTTWFETGVWPTGIPNECWI